MKSYLLAVIVVMASALCEPQMATAQMMAQGSQSWGMFGNRVVGQSLGGSVQGSFGNRALGQPFTPSPGNFGNWNPIALNGSLMNYGVPYGSRSIIGQPVLPQQIVQLAPSPQLPAPEYAPPQPPAAAQETAPAPLPQMNQPLPETNGAEGVGPTDTAAEITPSVGRAITTVAAPQAQTRTVSASAAGARPFVRSPELSDRLTRIARAKGMLSGPSLNVYLGNQIALLQGSVRSAGDRTLLANIIGLEPEVRQIDNELVAEGAGAVSLTRKSP